MPGAGYVVLRDLPRKAHTRPRQGHRPEFAGRPEASRPVPEDFHGKLTNSSAGCRAGSQQSRRRWPPPPRSCTGGDQQATQVHPLIRSHLTRPAPHASLPPSRRLIHHTPQRGKRLAQRPGSQGACTFRQRRGGKVRGTPALPLLRSWGNLPWLEEPSCERRPQSTTTVDRPPPQYLRKQQPQQPARQPASCAGAGLPSRPPQLPLQPRLPRHPLQK
mmetsp:Transcript_134628/g.304946  ORF Transcript_134628/g.304946 Transcript_134628/m.304946 type:complete len:217 (+) Transcript_134628:95-745(+)